MKKLTYILIFFFVSHFTFLISHLYSQTPTQEWAARYQRPSGSSSIANQMALDKVGNCYVLGNIPIQSGIGGILLIKYNSTGDTLWTRTYNIGNGTTANNKAVSADSIGNVYIAGYVGFGAGPFDIVIIKYDINGNQVWLKTYAGAGNVSDTPGGLKIGRDGMIYLAGRSGNSTLLVKFKPNGDTSWTRIFAEANFTSGIGPLEFDYLNNIYTGGNRTNLNTNENYYLAMKYDSTGKLIWNRNFTINGFETERDMTIDRFGNCFITGDGLSGYTTVKWDSSGVQQWIKTYPNNFGIQARGIVADLNGNCYVTGYIVIGGPNSDYFTIKYNPIGDTIWTRKYNGPGNSGDAPHDMTIDDSSNIYITGSSNNIGNILEYATIKYNLNGIFIWDMRYPGIAEFIAIDINRNVYVTGRSDSASLPGYVTIKYIQPTSGITPISNIIPKAFRLNQNYPNPFNPNTKIKFDILKSSNIKIIVYDVSGKEIAQLINEYVKLGEYEISFNGANLSSGIYFYKIISKEFTDTKKMVLIK